MNNEIIGQLASSLGRRDEVPNQELAQKIVQSNDQKAVAVLVEHLKDKRAVQNDCIKVLYEIGAVQASLIAPHASAFLDLLDTKNNRLQWGLLTAINSIVPQKASLIFQHIPRILHTAEQGSVISKDQAVNILINFCKIKKYQN